MTTAPTSVDLAVVQRFVDAATDALAQVREEVDDLNVYPVPDGDTGTNMYLTLCSGRDSFVEHLAEGAEEPGAALAALGRGALLGARGNSGVIFSEMLRAIAVHVAAAEPGRRHATVLADAITAAARAAWEAVGSPVEGTILSVARAAAEAAQEAADAADARVRDVLVAASTAARTALAATPGQLPTLAAAGVVDAGGRGLTAVLDAATSLLTGHRPEPVVSRVEPDPSARVARPGVEEGEGGEAHPSPAFEVMYLLEADAERLPALRARLDALGDSLVVVGEDRLWNVHVHVDDAGAAIEAGMEAGRPHRIRVTHLAEDVHRHHARHGHDHAGVHPHLADVAVSGVGRAAAPPEPTVPLGTPGRARGRTVVVVSAGPGLDALFVEAGAVVVRGGPGRLPSTGELLEAILAAGTDEVVVLTNSGDVVRSAEVAASTAQDDTGVRVAVVPTRAQVQGLAALAVHDPHRGFDSDVREMTATARQVRDGAVTVAARPAMTMAGPCTPGDVLGVVAGDFAVVGDDLDTVAVEVVQRLLAGGGELLTVVAGAEDTDGAAARVAAWAERHHPVVEVVVYDGGQERYPLLLSVE
ncbi:DAK2 domain-containing protein [Nocardioides sp. GY 10127]|uniref:DAK2 domain-containing protein n=1 Tax=Nocardioides sp. GY 10127 TaxID=2569762 RepID=UPI0010A8E50F|nr:DAK2 domain-containing protein [Nocardioides sp. GY 10127]TIC80826.1 DAK2 domain-containing protein [Nocardioides sp. GY 10127]